MAGRKQMNTKDTLSPEKYESFLRSTNSYKKRNYIDVTLRLRKDGKTSLSHRFGPLTREMIHEIAEEVGMSVNEFLAYSVYKQMQELNEWCEHGNDPKDFPNR